MHLLLSLRPALLNGRSHLYRREPHGGHHVRRPDWTPNRGQRGSRQSLWSCRGLSSGLQGTHENRDGCLSDLRVTLAKVSTLIASIQTKGLSGSPGLVVMEKSDFLKVVASNPSTVYWMDIFHVYLYLESLSKEELLIKHVLQASKYTSLSDKSKFEISCLVSKLGNVTPLRPMKGFQLKFSTMLGAVGLMTTYTIVLLQFKVDEKNVSKS